MIQYLKIGAVHFPEIRLRPSKLHKVRGFFADKFSSFDLIHNHVPETGQCLYRYPAFQFKSDDHLSIMALKDEAVNILKKVFLESEEINIEGTRFPIREKQIEVIDASLGEDGKPYVYSFTSPWLPLNQENYLDYKTLTSAGAKQEKLHAILVNNIIAFCKFAGYTVQQRLEIKSSFTEMEVMLKGKLLLAFKGDFMVNFLLPDHIGLGKSSSRGYGNITKKF